MKKIILPILIILNGICFAQTNEEQIHNIIDKQERDWNKNDMVSYAESFTNDGKLINFLGLFWKGKSEIIQQFKLINECCIKPTEIKLDISDMDFVNDSAAVVLIKETLTAKKDYSVPGKIVPKGSVDHKLITAVFLREQSIWKICSMQVTQVATIPLR